MSSKQSRLTSSLYTGNDSIICINSGLGRNLIIRELDTLGVNPRRVTHLFLTHSDFDHAKGLAVFEKAEIYLSSDEEPLITKQKVRMAGFIYNPEIKKPYHYLEDGEVVAVGPTRIRAIATPGHTSGSMSYLVDKSILFVGDAFKLVNNKVYPKRRFYNMDQEQHKESIKKLAQLEHVRLACTAHNGYTKEFSAAISDWK